MLHDKKIGFIGAGNMAESLIKGMLSASIIKASNIYASDIREDRLTTLSQLYRINTVIENAALVKKIDIIILATKPQMVKKVLHELDPVVSDKKLIISLAAGIPTSTIKSALTHSIPIVRVMPNTLALVQCGATAIAVSEETIPDDIRIVEHIFSAIGSTVTVDEHLIDAVTGLSGSGPAYIALVIEAMVDAGVKMGLSRDIALPLTTQTVLGTALMIKNTNIHPGKLKDMVTSPGGTTIYGLHQLEKGKVRESFFNAVEAATMRSKELGKQIK